MRRCTMTTPTNKPERQTPKQKPNPPTPAVQTTDCPNCGRKGVVVFSVNNPNHPDDTARLVCLHCCPKAPGTS